MITQLIWTIWNPMSSFPKKADKLNLSLCRHMASLGHSELIWNMFVENVRYNRQKSTKGMFWLCLKPEIDFHLTVLWIKMYFFNWQLSECYISHIHAYILLKALENKVTFSSPEVMLGLLHFTAPLVYSQFQLMCDLMTCRCLRRTTQHSINASLTRPQLALPRKTLNVWRKKFENRNSCLLVIIQRTSDCTMRWRSCRPLARRRKRRCFGRMRSCEWKSTISG